MHAKRIHAYLPTHLPTYVHTCIRTCVRTYRDFVCGYICVYTFICLYLCIDIHTHKHLHTGQQKSELQKAPGHNLHTGLRVLSLRGAVRGAAHLRSLELKQLLVGLAWMLYPRLEGHHTMKSPLYILKRASLTLNLTLSHMGRIASYAGS